MSNKNIHKRKTEKTKKTLIQIGRKLFVSHGFAETSNEQIVAKSKLTRGALYHHFKNKTELFAAVFEQVQIEIGQKIEAAASKQKGAWKTLEAGCEAWFEAVLDPTVQQIILIDGPSVLGLKKWRTLDEKYAVSSLKQGLKEAIDQGFLNEQPIEPLAYLLSGAMNEAALVIASSTQPEKMKKEIIKSFKSILRALKKTK